MTLSLGVNLRVTGHCNQGGRKYMEDVFSVAYQQTSDEKDLEYAFFGMFDGHGGREAAQYSKDHLMDAITKNKLFWSEDDDTVLKAIREGFLSTQKAMWNELPNWRKTATGLPSTAGTTASICFIKRGKLFIGHVGDSGIILGERDPTHPSRWRAKPLTQEHKPESEKELARIEAAGGKVMSKAGVNRVVWYRPKPSNGAEHLGRVMRSTNFDEVPFLAVARALGDLWSYNPKRDVYIVSPEPDLHVFDLNVLKDRCLVLATDGAWNVLSPEMAIEEVFASERNNERHMIDPQGGHTWVNPSKKLVDKALDRWKTFNLRADNTSIVTVMLDPPGPPRAQVLKRIYSVQTPKLHNELSSGKEQVEKEKVGPVPVTGATQHQKNEESSLDDIEKTALPENRNRNNPKKKVENPDNIHTSQNKESSANFGTSSDGKGDTDPIAVISRFPNHHQNNDQTGWNVVESKNLDENRESARMCPSTSSEANNIFKTGSNNVQHTTLPVPSYLVHPPPPPRNTQGNKLVTTSGLDSNKCPKIRSVVKNVTTEAEEQTPTSSSNSVAHQTCSKNIQIQNDPVSSPVQSNEITSSEDEKTPPPLPQRPPGGYGALNKRKSLCRELANLQKNACTIKSGSRDERRDVGLTKQNEMPGNKDAVKYTRSKQNESLKSSTTSRTEPQKDASVADSNSMQNHTVINSCPPRRPPRRSILMPSEEELESPTYNSDSENHQPVSHQLRSRATTRSSSVPLQSNNRSACRPIRSTSCANEHKKEEKTMAIELSNTPHKVSPNMSSNAVKQTAVNIGNRRSHLSQQPPPLPARRASAQNKILVTSNTPNTKSTDANSLPDKSLQSPSPRVLRPRNTPTVNKQAECVMLNNSSKIISTPKNMVSFSKDKEKSVPTKITARAVKFFEENIKRNNTGLKRKRRSFDASGHIPINKSAKLVRTAHTTRSCTWNNHAQTRSHLPNSLFPKQQLSQQYKLTPNKCKGLKT